MKKLSHKKSLILNKSFTVGTSNIMIIDLNIFCHCDLKV